MSRRPGCFGVTERHISVSVSHTAGPVDRPSPPQHPAAVNVPATSSRSSATTPNGQDVPRLPQSSPVYRTHPRSARVTAHMHTSGVLSHEELSGTGSTDTNTRTGHLNDPGKPDLNNHVDVSPPGGRSRCPHRQRRWAEDELRPDPTRPDRAGHRLPS